MDQVQQHEQAMERITRLLLEPPTGMIDRAEWEQELDGLLGHIASCSQCLAELDATIRVLTLGADTLLPSCWSCREVLPAYAELDEAEARQSYPLVWLHTLTCRDCQSTIARLRTMVANEHAGAYGPVPRGPTWLVSQTLTSPLLWQVREGLRKLVATIAVVRQGAELSFLILKEGRRLLPADFPGLQLAYATVPARRSPTRQERSEARLWTLRMPLDDGLVVLLTAYPMGDERVELEVQVQDSQGRGVAGVSVALIGRSGVKRPAVETDEEGRVLLSIRPKNLYTLELVQANRTWLVDLNYLA